MSNRSRTKVQIYHYYKGLCRQTERQKGREDYGASSSWVQGTKTKVLQEQIKVDVSDMEPHFIMNSDVKKDHIDSLLQDCSNSIALAMELL